MYPQTASEKFKILIVDDDEALRGFLANALESIGYEFVLAEDGLAARKKYMADQFDLIISDIVMPGMDGVELLQDVKNVQPEIDVVLITGYTEKYTFSEIIKLGASDFIEKPFTKDILKAKINRIQRERSLLQEVKIKNHAISERVKELNCLCAINHLFDTEDLSLSEFLKRTIRLVAEAWQYPECTAVRLKYNNKSYQTENFRKTSWYQVSDVNYHGAKVGCLEVYYLEKMPDADHGPFLNEEKNLINAVTQMLGGLIARLNAEKQLRLSNKQLEEKIAERTKGLLVALKREMKLQSELSAIFFSNTDGIITIDTQMRLIRTNNVNMEYLSIDKGRQFEPHHNHLQKECYKILQYTLSNKKGVKDYRVEMRSSAGTHVVMLLNSALLIDQDKHIWGALLNLHDITRIADLEEELSDRRSLREMVGESESIQGIYKLIRQVANVYTTVLITGETGTGKELVVDAMHAGSDLKSKPLIKINCAALPENLLESELFGHVKGAFTDAIHDRAGSIQEAEGGILFLDEIGEIPPKVQLRLLRFLENKEYQKVGSSKIIQAKVRVFAATNANLEKLVKQGKFRADLYYRLRVMCIHVPPLRERLIDISLLTAHFIKKFNYEFDKNVKGVSPEVRELFNNSTWPGNVRELKHVMEHAFLLCDNEYILPEHLPSFFASNAAKLPSFKTSVRKITKDELLAILHKTDWNKAKTARCLDISRGTLYNKLKEFQITRKPH